MRVSLRNLAATDEHLPQCGDQRRKGEVPTGGGGVDVDQRWIKSELIAGQVSGGSWKPI